MHSPAALAFSIRSPFPSMRRKVREDQPQWKSPIYFRNGKLRTSPFMTIAGNEFYFDSWVDVWHMEPGGADSGTVCGRRIYNKDGTFKKFDRTWRWHFWHYKVHFSLIYKWRRHLLTRCAECGGPSRKGNVVNHSDGGWGSNWKVPIYCGEVHLFHAECLNKKNKLHHEHDPRGCYACSGKASFEYNRNKPKRDDAKRIVTSLFADSSLERAKRARYEDDDDE